MHAVGINESDGVRQAAFCDFMRSERPIKDMLPLEATSYRLKAEREAAGETLETDRQVLWMMNTREFLDDWPPNPDDMWQDWAI